MLLTPKKNKISFFDTYISPQATDFVARVLKSGWISEGTKVKEFEFSLSSKLGLKHPVTVNSCTSALHLALVLAGVGPGDEVILPPQTFVATGLVVLMTGARPVFADIEYETGNISTQSVKEKITPKTKAILPVHWGGYPCDLAAIHSIAKRHNLIVIEDAAHALGAEYQNKPIGTISHFTAFSFQAIKHLTTGDGGALCCSRKRDYDEAINRRWFGIDRIHSRSSILGERRYDLKKIGYKYHLNDFSAALGLANLNDFGKNLLRRRTIAKIYQRELKRISGIIPFEYNENRKSSCWLYGFHVKKRNDFIRALSSRGVPSSVVHLGIDKNTILGGKKSDLVNQRKFDQTQIHIPLHSALTDEQICHITRSVKKGW